MQMETKTGAKERTEEQINKHYLGEWVDLEREQALHGQQAIQG